jgi:CBS domain containing-hemolysin-like protein
MRKVLIVPDRLTLAEVLEQFRMVHEDFAVIVNEYSLVVGVVTLNDVMSTVMGDLVGPADEEQIVRRDENLADRRHHADRGRDARAAAGRDAA